MAKKSPHSSAKSRRSLRAGQVLEADRPDDPQRLRFSASLPGVNGDSLLRMTVEAYSEPATGGGERLRLRAHLQANFASGLKPALAQFGQRWSERLASRAYAALPDPQAGEAPKAAQALTQALAPFARRAGGWLERRVQAQAPRLAATLTPLLSHDVQSWFELHASTGPLADGARALLPEVARLNALGIQPLEGPNAPPVQTWAGQIGNEVAQVSMLRLDDRQLPEALRERLGGQPFQLAAALVNLVARKP
ncbi:MAG: hypothetical protein EPN60_05115 [Nevskiaceae bacterium]|nr:MAG: hypothetical protein EPO48_02190 [Nevskiaceae bacterium]TAM30481.1 MAG: hypothetical protein EPN60_05115 [Nevskiaceae bacterium]